MGSTYAYIDKLGMQHEFPGHKIYKSGDETNSWWKQRFATLPRDRTKWIGTFISPLMKYMGEFNMVILNIDPEYHWCLAGEPCRKSAWFMQKSGTPPVPFSVIEENIEVLRKNGYKFDDEGLLYFPLARLPKI